MTYFECYPDESFLEYLGFTSKQLSGGHSIGRSRVSHRLMNTTNSIGLIDEDPGKPRDAYLDYLFGLAPEHSDNSFLIIRDKKRENTLIVLRPDLERMLVRIAKESHLDLDNQKYGLSMRPSRLHDILTPKVNLRHREKLGAFLRDASNNQSIDSLKKYLKQKE